MDKDKTIQKINSEQLVVDLNKGSMSAKKGFRDIEILPKIEELLTILQSQFKSKKYQDCIITSEEILEIDSVHFIAMCFYGRSLFFLERYEEALKALDYCLKEEKEYHFLWSFHGDVLYKLGKYIAAVNNYDKALELGYYSLMRYASNKDKSSRTGKRPSLRWNSDLYRVIIPEKLRVLCGGGFSQYSNASYQFPNLMGTHLAEITCFRVAHHKLFMMTAYSGRFIEIGSKNKSDITLYMGPARDALSKVIKLNPNNLYAIWQIAKLSDEIASKQIECGEMQNALDSINTALIHCPNSYNLKLRKVSLFYILRDKNGGIEKKNRVRTQNTTIRKSVTLDPDDIFLLGIIKFKWLEVLAIMEVPHSTDSYPFDYCEPTNLSGNNLTIYFTYKYCKEQADKSENQARIIQALQSIFNITFTIETILEQK